MTAVRRIMLALVTLMLIADVAALALVKTQGGEVSTDDPGTPETFKVVAKIDKVAQAKITAKAIEKLGVTVELEKTSRMVEKQTGFRLVFEASSVEILQAVAETLQYKGYTCAISEKSGQAQLYLGDIYPTKAKAAEVMTKVQRQESIKFEIVNGVTQVKVPTNKLVIRDVDQNVADKITEILGEMKVTDFEQIPVEAE